MSSKQKRSTRFYRRNEEEVMKSLGLNPTKNSGAGWIEKEDGQNEFLIAQLKSTDAQSISFKKEDWDKLEYHGAVAHKIPVFVVQFLQTNDIFVIARPSDIPNISKYLECGHCDIIKSEAIIPPEDNEPIAPKKVIRSSSKGREKFWKEKEQKWKK